MDYYSIAQFKLDIYMHVARELRIQQIYQVTCELHMTTHELCKVCYT